MEYEILSKNSAIPCLVVADADNGRYMIREADTSGEVFNNPREMLFWMYNNWTEQDFEDQAFYNHILSSLQEIVQN